jgi:hypothetical protein
MSDIFLPIIGTIVGSTVTGIISWKIYKAKLKDQFRYQQAYDFITKNFMPLLSILRLSIAMQSKIEKAPTSRDVHKLRLTFHDYDKLYNQYLIKLKNSLDSLVDTGILLLLDEIQEGLANKILNLIEEIRTREINYEDITHHPLKMRKLEYFPPKIEDLNELHETISKISISQLAKKYADAFDSNLSWNPISHAK